MRLPSSPPSACIADFHRHESEDRGDDQRRTAGAADEAAEDVAEQQTDAGLVRIAVIADDFTTGRADIRLTAQVQTFLTWIGTVRVHRRQIDARAVRQTAGKRNRLDGGCTDIGRAIDAETQEVAGAGRFRGLGADAVNTASAGRRAGAIVTDRAKAQEVSAGIVAFALENQRAGAGGEATSAGRRTVDAIGADAQEVSTGVVTVISGYLRAHAGAEATRARRRAVGTIGVVAEEVSAGIVTVVSRDLRAGVVVEATCAERRTEVALGVCAEEVSTGVVAVVLRDLRAGVVVEATGTDLRTGGARRAGAEEVSARSIAVVL